MDERLLWAGVAEDQRHDVLPEIWSGHNIADFVDPDIDEKLRALERDEDAAAAEAERLVSAQLSIVPGSNSQTDRSCNATMSHAQDAAAAEAQADEVQG